MTTELISARSLLVLKFNVYNNIVRKPSNHGWPAMFCATVHIHHGHAVSPRARPLQTSLHCCKSMPTVLTLPQPHDQHLNQELNWILLSSQQDQIKKLGNISCETGQCIRRDGNNRDTFSSISVQLPEQLFERRHSLCQPRQRGYRDD